MGWPQIVVLVLFGLELLVTSNLHGKPKTGLSATYNLWVKITDIIILGGLLFFGGFWS